MTENEKKAVEDLVKAVTSLPSGCFSAGAWGDVFTVGHITFNATIGSGESISLYAFKTVQAQLRLITDGTVHDFRTPGLLINGVDLTEEQTAEIGRLYARLQEDHREEVNSLYEELRRQRQRVQEQQSKQPPLVEALAATATRIKGLTQPASP